jgi:hypothetical protein
MRGFYLHIPLVRKLVLFCADRTALALQTLDVPDQRNNTGTSHCVSSNDSLYKMYGSYVGTYSIYDLFYFYV